jgi:hypothetical protein
MVTKLGLKIGDFYTNIGVYQTLLCSAKTAKKEAEKILNTIKEDLGKGQSSGDKIRDFIFAVHPNPEYEMELPFREIEKIIKGKRGNLFLVTEKELHLAFSGTERYPYIYETLSLGRLADDSLLFNTKGKEPVCFIQTKWKRYAYYISHQDPVKIVRDNLEIKVTKILELNQKLDLKEMPAKERKKFVLAFEIIVGNKAVKDWFSTKPLNYQRAFLKMYKMKK